MGTQEHRGAERRPVRIVAHHEEDPMTGNVAWLFPGQGSQAVGMARSLSESWTAAREVLVLAEATYAGPLMRIMFDGPAEALQATVTTQPAIVGASLAALAAVREAWQGRHGSDLPDPALVAGHSVGEFSALAASGATDFATALRLTCERARLMQWAAEGNPGTMAAVLGLDVDRVDEVCAEARATIPGSYVTVANHNSSAPSQVVIAGDQAGVDLATEKCKAAGARRVVPLVVGGAFHSPAMAPAREGLARAVSMAVVGEARVPLVANVTGRAIRRQREVRDELSEQVTSRVRWAESMATLASAGCVRFIEFGAGAVLSGLVQRAVPGAQVIQVGDAEGVARAVEWLEQ
jgi:[acyl-carrier-protein] S-malonyltransferase